MLPRVRHTTRRTARPVTTRRMFRRPGRYARQSSPLPVVLTVAGAAFAGLLFGVWFANATAERGAATASDRPPATQEGESPARRPEPATAAVSRPPSTPARQEAANVRSRTPDPRAAPVMVVPDSPAEVSPLAYAVVRPAGAELRVWPAEGKWRTAAEPAGRRARFGSKSGVVTVPSKAAFAENGGIEFAYRIPVGDDGAPSLSAGRMVFYGPWIGQGLDCISTIPWLKDLCDIEGVTVFTVRIPGPYDTQDKAKFYPYRESGWFEAIFDAQRRIAQAVGSGVAPIVATGDSAGGSLAQQLAAAEPRRVSASAFGGGGMFSAQRALTPHLVLSTLGDANNGTCRSLVTSMAGGGAAALFEIADREGGARSQAHYEHTTGPLGRALLGAYAGAAAKEPDPGKWRYRIDAGTGGGPFQTGGVPNPTWRDALRWKLSRHPLVPGCECPGAGTVPLPSERAVDLIRRMPALFQCDYPGAAGAKVRLIVGGPRFLGRGELSGVVIYLHPYRPGSEGTVAENCMRLAQSGIVAVAPFDPAGPDATDPSWWLSLADELKLRLGLDPGMLRVYETWETPVPDPGLAKLRRVFVDVGARAPAGDLAGGTWIAAANALLPDSGREWEGAMRITVSELGGGGPWKSLP